MERLDRCDLVSRLRGHSKAASLAGMLETAHITREAASEIEWLYRRVEEMNSVFGMLRMNLTLGPKMSKEVDKVMIQEER